MQQKKSQKNMVITLNQVLLRVDVTLAEMHQRMKTVEVEKNKALSEIERQKLELKQFQFSYVLLIKNDKFKGLHLQTQCKKNLPRKMISKQIT